MSAYGSAERRSPTEVFVVVPNVRAVSNGLVLICTLADGHHFGVPSHCIGERSEVRNPGDHGTLEVVQWFAELHELPTMV